MQKVVNAKTKTSLKSSAIIWDLDIYCPRGYYLSYNIASKLQSQEIIT